MQLFITIITYILDFNWIVNKINLYKLLIETSKYE